MEKLHGSKEYKKYCIYVEDTVKRLNEIEYLISGYRKEIDELDEVWFSSDNIKQRMLDMFSSVQNVNRRSRLVCSNSIIKLQQEKDLLEKKLKEYRRLKEYYYKNKDVYDEESEYKNMSFE